MADMAHLFHVRPWEFDRLTIWEFYAFCDSIDKAREAMDNG